MLLCKHELIDYSVFLIQVDREKMLDKARLVPHISFNRNLNKFIVAMIMGSDSIRTSTKSPRDIYASSNGDTVNPVKKSKGALKFKKAVFKTMESNEEMKSETYEEGMVKGYSNIDSIDGRYRFKIGIIDFLTNYNTKKFIENRFKATVAGVDRESISAIHQA